MFAGRKTVRDAGKSDEEQLTGFYELVQMVELPLSLSLKLEIIARLKWTIEVNMHSTKKIDTVKVKGSIQ